jgi:hypothetical protein
MENHKHSLYDQTGTHGSPWLWLDQRTAKCRSKNLHRHTRKGSNPMTGPPNDIDAHNWANCDDHEKHSISALHIIHRFCGAPENYRSPLNIQALTELLLTSPERRLLASVFSYNLWATYTPAGHPTDFFGPPAFRFPPGIRTRVCCLFLPGRGTVIIQK